MSSVDLYIDLERFNLKEEKKKNKRLKKKKTRLVITSGGNEPVMDSGNGGHSIFAYSLIKILNEKNKFFYSTDLFSEIRKYVLNNADQTPEWSILAKTDHDMAAISYFFLLISLYSYPRY